MDVVLAARNFQDVLDQIDYLNAIAAQDKHVAADVANAKQQISAAAARTKAIRKTASTRRRA